MSIKKCAAMGINLPFNAIAQAGKTADERYLTKSPNDYWGAYYEWRDAIYDMASECVRNAGYAWRDVYRTVEDALEEAGVLPDSV